MCGISASSRDNCFSTHNIYNYCSLWNLCVGERDYFLYSSLSASNLSGIIPDSPRYIILSNSYSFNCDTISDRFDSTALHDMILLVAVSCGTIVGANGKSSRRFISLIGICTRSESIPCGISVVRSLSNFLVRSGSRKTLSVYV